MLYVFAGVRVSSERLFIIVRISNGIKKMASKHFIPKPKYIDHMRKMTIYEFFSISVSVKFGNFLCDLKYFIMDTT